MKQHGMKQHGMALCWGRACGCWLGGGCTLWVAPQRAPALPLAGNGCLTMCLELGCSCSLPPLSTNWASRGVHRHAKHRGTVISQLVCQFWDMYVSAHMMLPFRFALGYDGMRSLPRPCSVNSPPLGETVRCVAYRSHSWPVHHVLRSASNLAAASLG